MLCYGSFFICETMLLPLLLLYKGNVRAFIHSMRTQIHTAQKANTRTVHRSVMAWHTQICFTELSLSHFSLSIFWWLLFSFSLEVLNFCAAHLSSLASFSHKKKSMSEWDPSARVSACVRMYNSIYNCWFDVKSPIDFNAITFCGGFVHFILFTYILNGVFKGRFRREVIMCCIA